MAVIKSKIFRKGHFVKLYLNKGTYKIKVNYPGPDVNIMNSTPWINEYNNISEKEVFEIFDYYVRIETERYEEEKDDIKNAESSGYATVFRDRSQDKDPGTNGVWLSSRK